MECVLEDNTPSFPSALTDEASLVRNALVERGLETPMINTGLDRDEKYRRIRDAFRDITETLGLDLTDDSLCETPLRYYRWHGTGGLHPKRKAYRPFQDK